MMNYPIPYSQANTAYFYANSVNNVGTFNKPINDNVQISIDYSKLTPSVAVSKVWFEIEPGGEPPLTINSVVITSTLVTFYVGGGYSDLSYNVTINAVLAGAAIRSDVLVVNVSGEDGCDCSCETNIYADNFIQFGTQNVFVNKYPRFFVSGTAPTNANLLDRWYNILDGNWYDYVTDGRTDFWVLSIPSTGGGGGGGTDTTGNITIKKMQPLAFDGVTTAFTLIATDSSVPNVTTSNSLFVSLDGVWQEPDTQFAASGASITFATPPPHDSYEFIIWIFGGIV
jgi:hypothetical protein